VFSSIDSVVGCASLYRLLNTADRRPDSEVVVSHSGLALNAERKYHRFGALRARKAARQRTALSVFWSAVEAYQRQSRSAAEAPEDVALYALPTQARYREDT
jgi:hypothetical protein